jgi:hypothetical protein
MTQEVGQHESEHFDFNDRYGVKPAHIWKRYAVAFAIIGGGWLLWAALHQANPVLRSELISFATDDPRKPVIRFLVERGDGADIVSCTLTARDYEKNVVGQIEEVIPAGERSVQVSVVIPTRAPAVNAGISSCRIL